MRWSMEMEEGFVDLEIMEDILEEKRTIKGNFNTGIYIKEKKADYEQRYVMDGKIRIYLPKEINKMGQYGMKFIYPELMGKYEEYAGTEQEFTIEELDNDLHENNNISRIKKNTVEEIQSRYEDTVITEIDKFEINSMSVESIMAEGIIGDEMEDYVGYIFFIDNNIRFYRFYIVSRDELWDITYKLGLEIIKNMELKEG